MIIARDIPSLRTAIKRWKQRGETIGLVPTMGFFHDGHLALMREARRHCRKCVATIFVNPRQFGPNEDLDRYPRNFDGDAELAGQTGVDLLFAPPVTDIYPEGYQTTVSLSKLPRGLCGESRPGHFDGVATVVTKLFNLVEPDIAVFGQKDYQQLALIRQMTADLNFDIRIIGHPIVREQDGLAMSSRNKYLNPKSRREATSLYAALLLAKEQVGQHGQIAVSELRNDIEARLAGAPSSRVDYIAVVDARTLLPKNVAEVGDLLALAVFFDEQVRLIDNIIL